MADFLDSVKKGVSAAVSRTSWEAQKQLRVRSKQTEIDKLLEQREKLLNIWPRPPLISIRKAC
jgi:hypothetical protein